MSELVTELEHGLEHVWFYAVPVGGIFVHQGCLYTKTGEERAADVRKDWCMEGHYGCLISKDQFETWGLRSKDRRPID